MSLLQIYQWVCQWKNFENRLTVGKIMGKSSTSCFLDSRCIHTSIHTAQHAEQGICSGRVSVRTSVCLSVPSIESSSSARLVCRHAAPTQVQVRLHWTARRSDLSSVNHRRSCLSWCRSKGVERPAKRCYVGLVAVGVQEQAEVILVPPPLRNCLTLNYISVS